MDDESSPHGMFISPQITSKTGLNPLLFFLFLELNRGSIKNKMRKHSSQINSTNFKKVVGLGSVFNIIFTDTEKSLVVVVVVYLHDMTTYIG